MRVLKSQPSTALRQEGLSLIEMVVVVLIMAAMSVPLGRIAFLNVRSTTTSYLTSEALNYAQGSMEEILAVGRRTGGWDLITPSYVFKYPVPATLTRTLTVVVDSLQGVRFKRVTVSVARASQQVSFSTLLVR